MSYAKFTTLKDAQCFTDFIHAYLCANRPGYKEQTVRWSEVTKHQSDELYAISLPPETIAGDYEIIDNLDGWLPEPEEME